MAVNAPLHLQGRMVVHQGHAVHRTMTGVATHSLINMNAVIEVDKIGKIIDAVPDERLATPEALPHRLEYRRIRPDLRMAVHAGLGRRNAGKTRGFDRGVAIAAINADGSHVVLMAERHRLRTDHAGIGHIGRSLQLDARPKHECGCKDPRVNRGPRNYICATVENLHRSEFVVV